MGTEKSQREFGSDNDQCETQFSFKDYCLLRKPLYRRIIYRASGAIIAFQATLFGAANNDVRAQDTAAPNPPTAVTAVAADRFKASVTFNIASAPLFEALQTLSLQSGIPVTLLPDVPNDRPSPAVSGTLTLEQALTRLLDGSGLPYRFAEGAIIIGTPPQGADGVEVLRPVSVVGSLPQVTIPTGNGDSGLSIVGEDMIKVVGTGDKDPVRVLRILPNVNWDRNQFAVSSTSGTGTLSEQDLTPERVSISGGKVYDNNFMIDGMRNTSAFDVTTTNEAAADTIGINNPMALFTNTDVLKEVAVYDSNVPARYSGFTGGVVDMRTRDPSDKFSGSAGYSHQTDRWVHYMNEGTGTSATDGKPIFSKDSYDLMLNAPIASNLRSLFAASKVTAEQKRVPAAAYSNNDKSGTESTRASYLGSFASDLSDDTTVSLKGLYAPYSQEFTRSNMANDRQITEGDNYSINGEVRHSRENFNANLALGFSHSGYTRDADQVGYTWKRTGSKTNLCSSGTSCVEGGYGDIADQQQNIQAKGDMGSKLLGVDWSTGFEINQTTAKRDRDQDSVFYFNPLGQANIRCAANDTACIGGEQALRSRNTYLARHVTLDTLDTGYWVEGAKNIPIDYGILQSADIRTGLRADYSDQMNNLNVAPRFSSSVNFPEKVKLTFGANRYYSTDSMVYALYQTSPNVLTQTRTVAANGTVGAWSAASPRYQYNPANVNTPYSDERTLALDTPLLWGDGRIKGLTRHTRDELAQTFQSSGGVITRTPNNNGWTDYKSLSLEWNKGYQNHAFLISGVWSNTERNGESYIDTASDADATRIYYKGGIIPAGQLPMLASNFAAPFVLNVSWTSKWLEDALTVNVTGKYKYKYDEIVDTGNDINIGGTNYSIYDKVSRSPVTRFDLTASYKIPTLDGQDLELLAYAENIFNARSQTATSSAPWERGRAYWFGARYGF